MRERMALCGGRLEITSSRSGTNVEALLPVRRASLQTIA
jgi:signal transduction histidine kinase